MPLVQRVQNICLKPKQEWDVIAGEASSTADLLKSYALPLAGLAAIARFIGVSIVGISTDTFSHARVPVGTGLAFAIVELGSQIAAAFVLSLAINELAPKFGAEKNAAQALKAAVYSFTPVWVAGILQILPALGALSFLVSLYGIYLAYLGVPRLMKSATDRTVPYTAAVVGCAIGILLITRWIAGAIVGAGLMAG
jgi:hypothetical protein